MFTSGLTSDLHEHAAVRRDPPRIRSRSSPVSQLDAIAISLEVCCSPEVEVLARALPVDVARAPEDVEAGPDLAVVADVRPVDRCGRRTCSRPTLTSSPGRSAFVRLVDRLVDARAGDPDRQADDRGMDDVAAVAAAVAGDERRRSAGPRARRPAPCRAASRGRTRARSTRARKPRTCRRSGPASTTRRRARSATAPAASATAAGHASVRPSARSEARRQATSGPMPISSSSGSPKMRRKKS